MRISVPLPILLGLQVIVVAAAFIAVILVLSEQQRTEFKDALSQRLSLRQGTALNAVAGPLLERKKTFDNFVEMYTNGNNNNKQFAAPADEPGMTDDFNRLMEFYKTFYVIAKRDPMTRLITFSNESTHSYPGYAVGGAYYNPAIHDTDNSKNNIWNVWGLDTIKMVYIKDETARACLGVGYPLDPSTCFQMSLYYDTHSTVSHPTEYIRNSTHVWGPPGLISDTTIPSGLAHAISYTIILSLKRPVSQLAIIFSLDHVKSIVYSYSATPASRSAVFSNYYRKVKDLREYYMVSGKVDFPDYNMPAFTKSQSNYYSAAWRGGQTPDSVLNAVFDQAQHMLPNTTGSEAFELAYGGKKYVASIARIVEPASELDWLLIQYTPREDFYAASERARIIGIVIGVAGAVVVLVTCVLMWVSIHFPLRSLQAGMDLAADMRNDEVKHIDPVLSEIRDIGDAFRQMNAKLLAARPFLPQSLLRGGNDSYDDTDGEEPEAADAHNNSMSAVLSTSLGVTSGRGGAEATSHSDDTRSIASHLSKAMGKKKPSKAIGGGIAKPMEYRRVSVLAINVLGFHAGIAGHPPGSSAVASLHTALARIIEQTVAEERGIVDFFHGDHFVCGFNTARLCGNGVRNSAEAATKVWERFLSYSASGQNVTSGDLHSAFPLGLAMGLSVGRAAVGNHGTETMQRLATIGGAYSEALRLQDVMGRRVLLGGGAGKAGSLNPLVAGRCLTMGRVIQDLETSNVYCQILGGVPAEVFLPAAEAHDQKYVRNYVMGHNMSAKKAANASASQLLDDGCNSVLVACLVSFSASGSKGNKEADDEWLYQLQNVQNRNPFRESNELLHQLWAGSVPSNRPVEPATGLVGLPDTWSRFVAEVCSGDLNAIDTRMKLTYGVNLPRNPIP